MVTVSLFAIDALNEKEVLEEAVPYVVDRADRLPVIEICAEENHETKTNGKKRVKILFINLSLEKGNLLK
jgi:hypothetical protein